MFPFAPCLERLYLLYSHRISVIHIIHVILNSKKNLYCYGIFEKYYKYDFFPQKCSTSQLLQFAIRFFFLGLRNWMFSGIFRIYFNLVFILRYC